MQIPDEMTPHSAVLVILALELALDAVLVDGFLAHAHPVLTIQLLYVDPRLTPARSVNLAAPPQRPHRERRDNCRIATTLRARHAEPAPYESSDRAAQVYPYQSTLYVIPVGCTVIKMTGGVTAIPIV